jgi:hypothetical protein
VLLAVLLISGAPILSCGTGEGEVSEGEIARAQAALAPFKQGLRDALTTAMREGGPELAIPVCQLEAPEIAASMTTGSARVGRTSHRLRNPENRPAAWTRVFLDEYAANPADQLPRAKRLATDLIGYVEPIHVQPICLTCHGETVAPGVRALLQEHYPDDEATGYSNGDLRGLFWVTLQTGAAD